MPSLQNTVYVIRKQYLERCLREKGSACCNISQALSRVTFGQESCNNHWKQYDLYVPKGTSYVCAIVSRLGMQNPPGILASVILLSLKKTNQNACVRSGIQLLRPVLSSGPPSPSQLPPVLLLSMTPYGAEYPLGQLGSAFLAVSPPNSLFCIQMSALAAIEIRSLWYCDIPFQLFIKLLFQHVLWCLVPCQHNS